MVQETATLYRMAMPGHVCPYGLKARHLLRRKGYKVDDRLLTTRAQVDAFKAQQGVQTTPQISIGDRHIGGHDDLRRYFGLHVPYAGEASYTPVIALFAIAGLSAVAVNYGGGGQAVSIRTVEWFIGLSMVMLAMLKLQNLDSFATMFLNYDLLAQKWVPYGRIYPFAEAGAGLLMLAGILPAVSVPVALVIGTVGAISVIKAVYVEKRTLKCACVGGAGNVPLGFLSLTENLMMVAMAVWMGLRLFGVHDVPM